MKNENALIPSQEELNVYQVMAKNAGQSQLFNKIGGEAGLLSIMLMARELGLPPLQSLMGGMNVIQGKVEVSPRLMNSMIRKAGHKIEIVKCDNFICILKGTRHDSKEDYTCSFSLEDAQKASLIKPGGAWDKFASDMLFARCLSRLARRIFADVISTSYIEGEIESEEEKSHESKQTIEVKAQVSHMSRETDPTSNLSDFLQRLASEADLHATEALMTEYLAVLVNERQVKGKPVNASEIIEHALRPQMTKRFINGYQAWLDAREDAEEALNKD